MIMYKLSPALLAVAKLSVARPAQDFALQPTSLALSVPFGGFPAKYLPDEFNADPIINTGSPGLKVPLEPAQHRDIEQTIELRAGWRPRGIELITSIAIRLYEYWKDTANLPITEEVDSRSLPFQDFIFRLVPQRQPGVILTPLKVGIVMMWVLKACLENPVWPGLTEATIWDATPTDRHARNVGRLILKHDSAPRPPTKPPLSVVRDTENKPYSKALKLHDTTAALQLPGNPSGSIYLSIPPDVERRWLECWIMVFTRAIRKPPAQHVMDTERPATYRPGLAIRLDYRCWLNRHPLDRISLWVPPARIPVTTWEDVALAMLSWIIKAAGSSDEWRLPQTLGPDPAVAGMGQVAIVLDGIDSEGVAST
ncbi:MAG: hypothetical protein Q9169_004777 [Polycauliona sp. 2 TL-2023]